ncbi:hypothetical protein [Micromonospora haikouensis]|uniref:hypothetical protein n=1 Tax=Micromonospora haikouensis TaxID=686309 RepID=UPI00378BAEC5
MMRPGGHEMPSPAFTLTMVGHATQVMTQFHWAVTVALPPPLTLRRKAIVMIVWYAHELFKLPQLP